MPNLLGVRPSFSTGFAQSVGESEYPELWRGLVAAYDPSLGQTGSRLIDWSGKLNHGTFVNDTHWVRGPNGWVLDFDGTGDYVDCGTGVGNLLGSANKNVSVSVVFKTDVTTFVNDGILDIGTFTGAAGKIVLMIDNDEMYFRLNGVGVNEGFSFTDVLSWHHALVTYDGVRAKMYLDNVLKVDVAYNTAVDFTGLKTIIGGYYSSVYCFEGKIDNVMIYNRALIPAEISLLYQLRKQVA